MNALAIVLSNWFYRSSWECQFTSPVSHDTKETAAKSRFDSKINGLIWQFPICASVYKDLLVFTGKKGRWLTIVFFFTNSNLYGLFSFAIDTTNR